MGKFSTPNLGVYIAGSDEQLTVQSTQADAVRFDLVRSRLRWPSSSEAPMLWATFLAWHALRREIKAGVRPPIPELTDDKPESAVDAFDALAFLDEAGNVLDDPDQLDDDSIGVDPTRPTA